MEQYFFSDMVDLRNDIIVKAYIRMRRTGLYGSLQHICRDMSVRRMRFYAISFRFAKVLAKQALMGIITDSGRHGGLYQSFQSRVQELHREHPDYSVCTLVEHSLLSPAPHIGLSVNVIYKIIKKYEAEKNAQSSSRSSVH